MRFKDGGFQRVGRARDLDLGVTHIDLLLKLLGYIKLILKDHRRIRKI